MRTKPLTPKKRAALQKQFLAAVVQMQARVVIADSLARDLLEVAEDLRKWVAWLETTAAAVGEDPA